MLHKGSVVNANINQYGTLGYYNIRIKFVKNLCLNF